MQKFRNLFLAVSLSFTVALCSGCLAAAVGGAAAGVGGYAYAKGVLETSERASIDSVYQAAQATVKQMEFVIETMEKDALESQVIARGVDDKRISIKAEHMDANLTRVKVRVGVFGDEHESRLILEKLRANLEAQ